MRFVILTLILLVANTSSARILSKSNLIIPSDFRFVKPLIYKGTIKPDVRYLQNLLNMNTETEIKTTYYDKSGSNGHLTNNFGSRTKSALERFHSFYRKDILDEYKNINPNATSTTFIPDANVLDFYTRAVMNKLIIKYFTKDDSSTTTATTTYDSTDSTNNNTAMLAALAAVALASSGSSDSSSNSSSNPSSDSSSASALIAFGGKSVSMISCTCSGNFLLYIQDPRGMTLPLMYQPGVTRLYQMGNPTVNVNLLGQYTSGGICLIPIGTGCASGGSPIGTMFQVGTSLSI